MTAEDKMPDQPEKSELQQFIDKHGFGPYSPDLKAELELLQVRAGRLTSSAGLSDQILKNNGPA